MATVKWDVLNQEAEDSKEGYNWGLSRTAVVYGLTATTGPKLKLEAIAAANTDSLARGEGGLTIGAALDTGDGTVYASLEKVSARIEPNATKVVYVTAHYQQRISPSQFGDFDIVVGSACQQEDTDHDRFGQPLAVSYRAPGATQITTKHVVAPIYTACSRITLTRTEFGSPANWSRLYTGKVNAGAWLMDGNNISATWMVNSIEGRSKDRSVYTVTYDMIYKPPYYLRDISNNQRGGWDALVFFLDKRGNLPTDDTEVPSEVSMFYEMKERVDFNTVLKLV